MVINKNDDFEKKFTSFRYDDLVWLKVNGHFDFILDYSWHAHDTSLTAQQTHS